MEIHDDLLCLFSASIETREGSYVLEVPERELEVGQLEAGRTYRIAVLPATDETDEPRESDTDTGRGHQPPGPPVEEGDTREVEIEDIGEQGDGIARVERGYVVIVPEAEKGERVRIEISDVRENVAFANVVERLSYYE